MSNASPQEEAQLLSRLTVLELVVGMMVRDSMIKSGKGPQDILGFGETVKKFLEGRTPTGANPAPAQLHVEPPTSYFRRSRRISEARTAIRLVGGNRRPHRRSTSTTAAAFAKLESIVWRKALLAPTAVTRSRSYSLAGDGRYFGSGLGKPTEICGPFSCWRESECSSN